MNCSECHRLWEIYYDSEGDSELYLEINDHLAGCPSCSKRFFQQARFEDAVSEKLASAEPTAELWQRVLSETGVVRPVAARRWALLGPFFVVAASLSMIAGIWQFKPPSTSEHLSALTAVVHQRLAEGSERIEFRSVSDEEVEAYLKQRVPFAVRCPPRQDAGFIVRGGGACDLGGDLAAYVVGEVESQNVSIFILPETGLARFAHERDILGREAVHHCQEGEYDMVLAKFDEYILVVIGKGTRDQLERVARAYGTYHETPKAGAV